MLLLITIVLFSPKCATVLCVNQKPICLSLHRSFLFYQATRIFLFFPGSCSRVFPCSDEVRYGPYAGPEEEGCCCWQPEEVLRVSSVSGSVCGCDWLCVVCRLFEQSFRMHYGVCLCLHEELNRCKCPAGFPLIHPSLSSNLMRSRAETRSWPSQWGRSSKRLSADSRSVIGWGWRGKGRGYNGGV